MLTINYHKSFKQDYKRIKKQGADISLLEKVIGILQREEPLPAEYLDHQLKGNYTGFRELHIKPDWLLIYKINGKELLLILQRTGSHSELFR
jgi:mRNA interferase YafQ